MQREINYSALVLSQPYQVMRQRGPDGGELLRKGGVLREALVEEVEHALRDVCGVQRIVVRHSVVLLAHRAHVGAQHLQVSV